MSNPVVSWAKDHPVAAGAAALGVIVVVMLATGGGSGDQQEASGGMGSAGVQAYYAAVAQQGQAGAAIQISQIKANAETNKALIAANYGLEKDKIWAPIYSMQIDQATEMQSKALDYAHAENNNAVNLANAQLTQEQNIAFKKINAARPSVFSQILGAATTVGTAYLTGGTSLLAGSAAKPAKLPALGSSGEWA